MAKKLNSVLGVDIGSQHIKIAEIRNQGNEPVVTALGMIATPEGAVDHTGVYNSDAIAVALKQVLNESGASVPHAVISIAGQASVLVRTLEVPRMNPAELKEHMQWEINRNIPFSESNVVSDYQPLETEDPASQNMDVVMAISPQSAIDTVIACVKKAGRQAAAIDVEPLSMARSLRMSYDDAVGNTICLVEIGHKTMSINIYRDGKLLMPRQVPLGGEMFTKAIADALGVSNEEAETIKLSRLEIPISAAGGASLPGMAAPTQEFQAYNPFADEPAPTVSPAPADELPPMEPAPAAELAPMPSASSPDSTRIYNAVAPVLEELVAEIRRSIDYFRSRGGDVQNIMLAGGGSKIRGLAAFLNASLGLPCDVYDPVRRLNLNVKKVAPGFVDDHREEMAVAIGNALHIFF